MDVDLGCVVALVEIAVVALHAKEGHTGNYPSADNAIRINYLHLLSHICTTAET
jgi:hypothetical protein